MFIAARKASKLCPIEAIELGKTIFYIFSMISIFSMINIFRMMSIFKK
jgi:hypothetical protein